MLELHNSASSYIGYHPFFKKTVPRLSLDTRAGPPRERLRSDGPYGSYCGILGLRETTFVTGTVQTRIVIPVENRIKNVVQIRVTML